MDARNFRSIYYGKVGFKGIEEKKSLEVIMKEEPLDTIKLTQFCQKFPIPVAYRTLIWQVLLGVYPVFQSSHSLACDERRQQFEILKRAVDVINQFRYDTERDVNYVKMYMIQEKYLQPGITDKNLLLDNANFHSINRVMNELIPDDEVCAFWLSVKLTTLLEKNIKTITFNSLYRIIRDLIKRSDYDLANHLGRVRSMEKEPLLNLFLSGFANVFNEDIIQRIWDRLIGGCTVFLAYIFVAILIVKKKQVLDKCELTFVLSRISSEQGELIYVTANDLWFNDGSPVAHSEMLHS